MAIIPNLSNADLRSVTRSQNLLDTQNRFNAWGCDAVEKAVLDGGKITASERRDVLAMLGAGMFDADGGIRMKKLLGIELNAVIPPTPCPGDAKLVNRAVNAMKQVAARIPSTQGLGVFYDSNAVNLGARAVTDAFLNVAPDSADGKRLAKAYVALCEKSLHPLPKLASDDMQVGHVVFSVPQQLKPVKNKLGAMLAGQVYANVGLLGMANRLPEAARPFFVRE